MANTYTYDNQALGSSGTTEHFVREGYIQDPDYTMQPRTVEVEIEDEYEEKSQDQLELDVIRNYNKSFAIVWEQTRENGKEYVTYNGSYWVAFDREYRSDAVKFRDDTVASGNRNFKFYERDNKWLFVFEANNSLTQDVLMKNNINLEGLREEYDNRVEDITSLLSDITKEISLKDVKYFMFKTLEEKEEELLIAEEIRLFSTDPSNFASYYFGNTSHHDAGFYRDHGNRIRISYNAYQLFRSAQLIQDLLKYAEPEQYAVGLFSTGVVQFVLSKELSATFVELFGSESKLARRWYSTSTRLTEDFEFGEYPEFEDILYVPTSKMVPSSKILDYIAGNGTPKGIAV